MTAVASWYDAGSRLTVDDASVPVVADDVVGLPSFFTASMAATSPQLVEKALTYEAEIASKQARLDAFPKQEGTMCGILRDQIKVAKLVLAATVEEAREVEARGAGRREAYYCTDAGCWIAEQYFCDETGCWITDTPAVEPVKGVVAPTNKAAPSAAPEKTIVQEGIFAPAVKLTAQAMGRKELNAFRASVIAKHTKVISAFVDTSESKFGQIALKSMFEAADKDGNGTLDKEEVKEALQALGFTFVDDKEINKIFKRADSDKNDVIDFEEFVKETPKTLRTSLVKLAKSNGHDLGFLA